MEKTIFEKIIDHEIPADIVYEDDLVLAFLDIKPVNHGHTLVIPKQKFVNVFDADPAVFAHMATVAQKIAIALRSVTQCGGVNITMNNGSPAGQEVFHAHIHIFPRYINDSAFKGVHHLPYDGTIAKELTHKLSGFLV